MSIEANFWIWGHDEMLIPTGLQNKLTLFHGTRKFCFYYKCRIHKQCIPCLPTNKSCIFIGILSHQNTWFKWMQTPHMILICLPHVYLSYVYHRYCITWYHTQTKKTMWTPLLKHSTIQMKKIRPISYVTTYLITLICISFLRYCDPFTIFF